MLPARRKPSIPLHVSLGHQPAPGYSAAAGIGRRHLESAANMSTPTPPRVKASPPASPHPQRPELSALQTPRPDASTSNTALRPNASSSQTVPRRKRNHRGGKKKRTRKQSFAVSAEDGSGMPERPQSRTGQSKSASRSNFYSLQGHNLSNTSIESEELLDHRWDNARLIIGVN